LIWNNEAKEKDLFLPFLTNCIIGCCRKQKIAGNFKRFSLKISLLNKSRRMLEKTLPIKQKEALSNALKIPSNWAKKGFKLSSKYLYSYILYE
jgi:hypothetical protein